ncbi:MAG TPA: MBL fold metallo-hydrolase [Alphaproteobacteria bacterium]|nr:MBL fold metallo-hydrolase [Alphaproteobacteria bacterium]
MPPINTNSVLLSVGSDCVVFDAWGRASDWKELLKKRKLNLCAIYSTHGHSDHISAAPELAEQLDIPWYMSHFDITLIEWGNPLLEYFEIPKIKSDYKQPLDLPAGIYDILGLSAMVIDLPGHSRGGVGFYFESEKILIVGDTIFADSIGRYDLPGANLSELKNSISKIYDMNLSDDTVVVSGHGTHTTIGDLKKQNPYFKK